MEKIEPSLIDLIQSQIKKLENNTDADSFNKRYTARKELAEINKSAPENPILDELKLIDKQEQKNPDALPILSDQRINLYTELHQMTNQNLSKKEAVTKAQETELNNLQKKLKITTELNNPLIDNKSPNGDTKFNKNIGVLTTRINKIQNQLGNSGQIITPKPPEIFKISGFTTKKPKHYSSA